MSAVGVAVAWALTRTGHGDDFLVVKNVMVRITASEGTTPTSAVILFPSPEAAQMHAISLTEVVERMGSHVTYTPRMLDMSAEDYAALRARATGLREGMISDRWKVDKNVQRIVLRVLTQGVMI